MRVHVRDVAALLALLLSVGCSTPAAKPRPPLEGLDDVALWESGTLNGAINELRCKGLSADSAVHWYKTHFALREQRIQQAMQARYGDLVSEDQVLTGYRCPFYRGAIKRHERRLRLLEKRLGLRTN